MQCFGVSRPPPSQFPAGPPWASTYAPDCTCTFSTKPESLCCPSAALPEATRRDLSTNNVDLEDGEIDDDEDDNAVLAVSAAPPPAAPAPPPTPSAAAAAASGPSTPRAPPTPKNHDRREHHDSSNMPPWLQKRLGPPPAKMKKNNKGSWGPPKSNFVPEEDDDDFAVHLEKALQEKAREKAKQAGTDIGSAPDGEEVEGETEDNDQWSRKRRKRKKNRDDDDSRDSKKKRREGVDDEDDMIFVRGASPHHHDRPPSSPPYRDYEHDRSFESFGEEEEEYDGSPDRSNYNNRGRGRGNKMRGGGRGRGRMSASNDGRGGFMNKRGGKRGNRGSPAGKFRGGRERTQDTICEYFMQGKCPKDADECPYSHDATPRRKMELCKFYNMNCCAKREKCLYMHKDFPCKYFHTGRRCNSGDKCKFSHDSLTDMTRIVLLKHIELAPKEILGEFRRLTREQANQIIDRAAKLRSEGKNPEGIDLLRMHEDEGNESGDERSHTPMPSSPGEVVPSEPEIRNKNERRRDRDRDRNRDRNHGGDKKEHSDRREHRDKKRKKRWDSPENSPARLFRLQEELQRQLKEQDDDEKALGNNRKQKHAAEKECVDDQDKNICNTSAKDTESSIEPRKESESVSHAVANSPEKDETSQLDKQPAAGASVDSGDESQDSTGNIPMHLPKRQQELFLRIQQQQRRAEENQEDKVEDSEDEAGAAEDDWYSSDEDGPTSLTDVLKNLKDGKKEASSSLKGKDNDGTSARHNDRKEKPLSSIENETKNEEPQTVLSGRRPPLLPTPSILTDLMKNTAIDQLLSTIRYGANGSVLPASSVSVPTPVQAEITSTPLGIQSPTGLPSTSGVPMRDPRRSRDPRDSRDPRESRDPRDSRDLIESRDPRSRNTSIAASSLSPSASPSSNASDSRIEPRLETRTDPRSERRDPRTDRNDVAQPLMDALSSPRIDQRNDPRSLKADGRRSSDGSNSSLGNNVVPQQRSIYESANMLSGTGDVDLRIRNIAPETVHDTDFRKHLGTGDMDMRRDLTGPNVFSGLDTDLRFRMGHSSRENDNEYAAVSHSDLDLRHMGLPFKPPPIHTPATEINASVLSYTPGAYHVVVIDIPTPDFSQLKIDPKNSMVKLDPRLRKVFGLSQSEANTSTTPASPPAETSPHSSIIAAPVAAPSDPRRRNSNSSVPRRVDPRQARVGATATCPPTPRMDDFDEPTVTDTDLRMHHQFGRQGSWDNMTQRGRGLLPHPNDSNNWMPNASSSFGRVPHMPQHSYQHQRSYTPPPT
ncbi:zinc finger CCCH domain-containing protein 13 isoform X3 [Thrips palmi]|uniref:Zinc finger CCCH domain-containing protein 13 isoform X3 n=1 Tax=Thrips palmi TaxID=161013 RepID=A0A6P9A8U2_THRPL|nr:zinc finger CCCH domain-containing protein 13 isoform X3 [Thrips palmi]